MLTSISFNRLLSIHIVVLIMTIVHVTVRQYNGYKADFLQWVSLGTANSRGMPLGVAIVR